MDEVSTPSLRILRIFMFFLRVEMPARVTRLKQMMVKRQTIVVFHWVEFMERSALSEVISRIEAGSGPTIDSTVRLQA